MTRHLSRIATLVAASAMLVGTLPLASASAAQSKHDPKPPPVPSEPTPGACGFAPLEDQTYSTFIGLPHDPKRTPSRGESTVVLDTNQGDIPIVLERAKAPCTVLSFEFLTRKKYFDGTECHRLTAYTTAPAALSVLQCGDPLGTGWGDPGYAFKDELASAQKLANWPGFPDGSRKVYPRGTLAMANGGPDTNGSQFFLVYEDSRLRPDYTVFGHVSERGMRVLDRIAAGGIDPGTEGTPEDGAPAMGVTIVKATRSAGTSHNR